VLCWGGGRELLGKTAEKKLWRKSVGMVENCGKPKKKHDGVPMGTAAVQPHSRDATSVDTRDNLTEASEHGASASFFFGMREGEYKNRQNPRRCDGIAKCTNWDGEYMSVCVGVGKTRKSRGERGK